MIRNTFLLKDVATTLTGSPEQTQRVRKTFQAVGKTTAGAGSASVDVEVSNNKTNWLLAGTITLTLGTTETSDGFESSAHWVFVRGKVTAISGTGATVSLIMGL